MSPEDDDQELVEAAYVQADEDDVPPDPYVDGKGTPSENFVLDEP